MALPWAAATATTAPSLSLVLCSSPSCGNHPLSRAHREVPRLKRKGVRAARPPRRHTRLALSKAEDAELPDDAPAAVSALEKESEELSQLALIWRAIKLPIYSVALVPLTVSAVSTFSFRLLLKQVN